MLLARISYNRDAETYLIALSIPSMDLSPIIFKFDTGASSTIITTGSLCESEEDMLKLAYFLESCNRTGKYVSKLLCSASGNHMRGILCRIKDFRFSNVTPFTFYFYLVYSTSNIKALLGADFISCCDCNLKANEDIEITRFYDGIYKGKFGFADQSGSLDFIEVMKALSKIQLPKGFEAFKTSNGRIDLQEFLSTLDSIDDWVNVGKILNYDNELKSLTSF